MSPRLIPPSLAVAAPVVAGLLLTGCGGSTTTVSTPSGATVTTSAPSTTATANEPTASKPSSQASEPSTEQPSSTATDEAPSSSEDSHTDGGTLASVDEKFQVSTPAGWHSVLGTINHVQGMQVAVAAGKPSGDKLTNITVITVPSSITDTSSTAKQNAQIYRKKGKTVKMLPSRTIAGEQANGYRKHDKANTQSQTQWFLGHSGKVYIVTLTNSPSAAADADRTLDGFIGSWAWK